MTTQTREPGSDGRRSSKWSKAKLTNQQRDEVRDRRANGESVKALALEFGVSANTIRLYSS